MNKPLVIPRHVEIASKPFAELAGATFSNDDVANSVRMLTRNDLGHEAVCTVARDRIVWLAGRVDTGLNLIKHWNERADECDREAERMAGQPVANELARDAAQYRQCAYQLTIAMTGRPS
jgi:hypothetical protein